MAWKENFRAVALNAAIPAVPVVIEVVGYPTPALIFFSTLYNIAAGAAGVSYVNETITSLSKATQTLSSMVHRWNSLGTDAIGVVLGMPIGADPVGSLSPLPAGAQNEQQYVHFDIPSRDLKHAISSANKTATSGNGTAYGTDYASDLSNVVLL